MGRPKKHEEQQEESVFKYIKNPAEQHEEIELETIDDSKYIAPPKEIDEKQRQIQKKISMEQLIREHPELLPDSRIFTNPHLPLATRLWCELKRNPIIPIGISVTLGSFVVGVRAMMQKNHELSHKMMKLRVGAGVVTLASMLGMMWYQQYKLEELEKELEKRNIIIKDTNS